jgi:hypothetical protein
LSYRRVALSSSRCTLTAPPSCCLISLAGCCVTSCCTALLLSSHSATHLLSCTGWLLHRLLLRCPLVLLSCCPLNLSLYSHCVTLSLSHLTGWLLHCLSLHCPLVVLSLRGSLVILHWLVVVSPLLAPPSCPLPSCSLIWITRGGGCIKTGVARRQGEARCCLDAPAAAAKANDADICTIQQTPSNPVIDGTPCIGGGLRRGMGVLGWQPLSSHVVFRCYNQQS